MKWNRVETCQCCHHRNIDAWRSVGSPPRLVYLECRDCHLCGTRRMIAEYTSAMDKAEVEE